MSEERNEVLEQQRRLLERRMYRLDPAPPKLPAQEYIVRYLTEKEDKYLTWYLHDQEPALNKLAQAACERYAMAELQKTPLLFWYPGRPSKVRSGCRRAVCRFSKAVYTGRY
mgnify:CR=1 FL=1